MTRAAERLGLRQPPLSQQIRALETELDVRLFRRTPKGMEPTAPAHVLYNRVRSLVFQLDETIETVRSIARGEAGRLAVGVSSSAAFSPLIPRLIRSFRSVHPQVEVSLSEDSAEDLVEGLRSDAKDVVFTRSLPESAAGISVATLIQEPMFVALPSNHGLRPEAAAGLDLADLKEETFILYRRPGGPGLYDSIIAACQRAGFSPTVRDEALRMASTLNFVAAGLGVSVVPESLTRLDIEGIMYASINDRPMLTAPLNIVYRCTVEGAARRFVTHARSAFPAPADAPKTPD